MRIVDEAGFLEPAELALEGGANVRAAGDVPAPRAAAPRRSVDAVVDEEGHRSVQVVPIEGGDQLTQEPDRVNGFLGLHELATGSVSAGRRGRRR